MDAIEQARAAQAALTEEARMEAHNEEAVPLGPLGGTAKLNAALSKAQGEFPPIPREKTVKVQTKAGGQYTFSYAPLEDILRLTRPALTKNGLALTQLMSHVGGEPYLETNLLHSSGEVIGSSWPLGQVVRLTPQELGSLLTYIRRYAVTAILGVATEEDDDAQHAAGGAATTKDAFEPPAEVTDYLSEAQQRNIRRLKAAVAQAHGMTDEVWRKQLREDYGTDSVSALTKQQASALIERLKGAVGEA